MLVLFNGATAAEDNASNLHDHCTHTHILLHAQKSTQPQIVQHRTTSRQQRRIGSNSKCQQHSSEKHYREATSGQQLDISGMSLPRAPKHSALLGLQQMPMEEFRLNPRRLQQGQRQKSRERHVGGSGGNHRQLNSTLT